MTRPTEEQIKALRKGDVVTVRAVVFDPEPDNDGDLQVRVITERGDRPAWLLPSEIMTIKPREIKVGDRVRNRAIHDGGTVRCIERGYAAVLFDSGLFKIYPLDALERLT